MAQYSDIEKIEATLVELRTRQEAQPKKEVQRRMRLAVLIAAFERRRDLLLALRDQEDTFGLDKNCAVSYATGAGDCGGNPRLPDGRQAGSGSCSCQQSRTKNR